MSVVTLTECWSEAAGTHQVAVSYPACSNAQQSGVTPLIAPLALAGQVLRVDADLEALIRDANREHSRSLIAKSLSKHISLISDLNHSGFITDSLLNCFVEAAKDIDPLLYSDALSVLMNDSLAKIHSLTMKAVTESFSGLPELRPMIEQTIAELNLFHFDFRDTEPYRMQDTSTVALVISESDYFGHYFLGLDQFDASIQPYLYRAVQLAVNAGGGATADLLLSMDYSELEGAVTEDTLAWISNCIEQIERLPSDASVEHLFCFNYVHAETPLDKLHSYLDYSTILMDGSPDEVDRDDLLNALVDTQRLMEVIMYYSNLEKGVNVDIEQFLALPLPDVETELCRKVRSVVEVVAARPVKLDPTIIKQPDDMYYPFGFVMHPSELVHADQEYTTNAVYEMAMNSGENYEAYFPDTANGAWVEQVKSFALAIFSAGLLYKLISTEAEEKTKTSAN